MRKALLATCLILLASAVVIAQQHTIIALSHGDHTVNEVDPVSGKIVQKFTAVDQPHEGQVTSDGKIIYASVPQGPHVVILDATTFKEKTKIESEFFTRSKPLPPPPAGRGGGEGRGRGEGRGGGEGRGANRPNTSASPHGVALNNDGSKLYIGVENAEVPGVVVYDTKSGKVLKKVDLLLRGGHYLSVQPRTDKLYYPHRNDNRVVVLDTKTDKVTAIIPVEGGPVGVAFAPNGEVWIHGDGDAAKPDSDGQVAVIDSKKDEVIKVIKTPGKGAGRMAVSPDGKWAASTHGTSEDVAIIDTAKKEVVSSVKIGRGPGFPLFSPDSTKLYVMNSGMGDIAVIDLKTMAVTGRHKVGTDPFGGGIRFPNGKPTSQN